jgi:CubicO group peptidase (beta-lactamase class C family)
MNMMINVLLKFRLQLCLWICCALGATVNAQPARELRAFMNETIACGKYVFPPGSFPKFRWEHEYAVEQELGKFPLTVTYFNAAFERVTSAETSGRYGAVVEGTAPSGFVIRRYVTLFCAPVEFDDYSMNVPVKLNNLRAYGIAAGKWDRYSSSEERFAFGSMKFFPQHDPDAAVFLAGLSEIDTLNSTVDTPRIRDRQWWITLKNRLEAKSIADIALRAPRSISNGASVLPIDTSAASSHYDQARIESLRTVCRRWADNGGMPHVTLVVHKGRIIFHEAFGTNDDGAPVTTESLMWMASITKLLTGTLMMQFVDQGLVELDAPVGRYLSELAGNGNEKLTVRQLFTHTTGLSFAGDWASDWNVALDNQIAQVLPSVEAGEAFSYNRVGYAVAGKIMERITGRAVPLLFHDDIFAPLGMKTAYADNTYGGLYCSSSDLARFAEVLLHKGTYSGCTFFTEQTFEKMLPQKLPVGNRRWGIGTAPMDGHGLSALAFGHAAASGTILRIDPANDLVIISARNAPGRSHDEFAKALIECCTALVHQH